MTLTKNEKIAAGVGAAAVIVIGIGAAVAASKAKAAVTTPPAPTAPSITLSITPTSLPSSGGEITIDGTTNIVAGTTLYFTLSTFSVSTTGPYGIGDVVMMLTVKSDGTFSGSYNMTVEPVNFARTVYAQVVYLHFFPMLILARSNTVVITLAQGTIG